MRPHKTNGLTDAERDRRCTGKRRWPDQLSVMAGAVSSLEKTYRPEGLYYYRCPYCKGWHLTKSKQSGQEPVTLEKFKQENNNGF